METKISDIISKENIILNHRAKDGKDLLESVINQFGPKVSKATDFRLKLLDALQKRESVGSTAIGNGIALPHARLDEIDDLFLGLVKLASPIDFLAVDRENCDLFFFLFAPSKEVGKYLKTLSRISRLLKDPEFSAELRSASDPASAYKAIANRD